MWTRENVVKRVNAGQILCLSGLWALLIMSYVRCRCECAAGPAVNEPGAIKRCALTQFEAALLFTYA